MRAKQCLLLGVICLALAVPAYAQQGAVQLSARGKSGETTLADQTDVAVTVYNNNRALVRDQRSLTIPTGTLSLRFMDVAELIQPETVSLRSLAAPGSLEILEQNYEYDLMSPDKLMEKYVGQNVKLINKEKDMDFYEVDAKLLSVNNGPVYEIDGKIYLGHPGTVVLPSLPDALIAKPTLVWLVENSQERQQVEATYLTGGLSWKADYVLTLAKDEKTLDIEGWVTLDNQSGATYTNAKLKLVAGDVNVVREQAPMPMMDGAVMMRAAKAMPQEESFAEYHLYTLPRRTTVKQNQSKQVSLLGALGVKITKKYEFRGNASYFFSQIPPLKEQHVGVFLEFENREANHLGVPLPAGIMRVYQPDSEGMLQFAGEDRIQHTPKDETVRLKLGDAFDVIGERTQTDFRMLGNTQSESAYKITIRNHKDVQVTVDIVEPMPGDWEVVQSSQEYVKKDARTAVFSVGVPADGPAEVTYRVRVRR